MKKIEWNSKYKTISVYAVITAFVIICIALIMTNLKVVGSATAEFFSILAPFIFGFAAAYLLARPCAFLEHRLFGFLNKRRPHPKLSRALSILVLFIIIIGGLILLTYSVIPQIIDSLASLMANMQTYLFRADNYLGQLISGLNFDGADLRKDFREFMSSFLNVAVLFKKLIERLPQLISSLGTGILNTFISMIVCVYALFSREKFSRQAKKLIYAVFNTQFADHLIDIIKYSNNVFLGYVMGTLLSTAFIGISTFLFLSIFKMPYALLITVLITITNFIPMFGPFLGAIPSALLLITINPWYAVSFLIFILVLQQVDGNIVLPKLISMNVGLSAFWILFALIIGAGLFGIWGLILGVPAFAVIYSLSASAINRSLEKKEVPKEDYTQPEDFKS